MSIKLGFKKSSIVFAVALLSIGLTAKAGVVYDYIKNNNELSELIENWFLPYSSIFALGC